MEKEKTLKVYCEKCDELFSSRSAYESHVEKHSGVACDSCPIDMLFSKFTRMFKRGP